MSRETLTKIKHNGMLICRGWGVDCCGVRVMCAVKNGRLQSSAHLINSLMTDRPPPHRLNWTIRLLYTTKLHLTPWAVKASLANVNILANVNYIKRFTKVPITLWKRVGNNLTNIRKFMHYVVLVCFVTQKKNKWLTNMIFKLSNV